MASKVATTVRTLAEPICRDLGYELVDVTYSREGGKNMLRLFIDKPGGVTLDDCELFSKTFDPVLDQADPVPGSYYLEVSSPGLGRPLKSEADFRRFIGSKVRIRTFSPINGSRNFQGALVDYANGGIRLRLEDAEVAIPLEQIGKANIVPEF